MDDLAKASGFENAAEMLKLTADADLSTHEKIEAFENWRDIDGTKEGLLKLNWAVRSAEIVKQVREIQKEVTPDIRLKLWAGITDGYCWHCGNEQFGPVCHCTNDE